MLHYTEVIMFFAAILENVQNGAMSEQSKCIQITCRAYLCFYDHLLQERYLPLAHIQRLFIISISPFNSKVYYTGVPVYSCQAGHAMTRPEGSLHDMT